MIHVTTFQFPPLSTYCVPRDSRREGGELFDVRGTTGTAS